MKHLMMHTAQSVHFAVPHKLHAVTVATTSGHNVNDASSEYRI